MPNSEPPSGVVEFEAIVLFDSGLCIGVPGGQSPIARLVIGFHVHAAESVTELLEGRVMLESSVLISTSPVALAELFEGRLVLLGKSISVYSSPVPLFE